MKRRRERGGEREREREKKNLEPGRIFGGERVHARCSTFGNERLPDESDTEGGGRKLD